jgi:hypothetical protein
LTSGSVIEKYAEGTVASPLVVIVELDKVNFSFAVQLPRISL